MNSPKERDLLKYSEEGNLKEIINLVKKGVNVNCKSQSGETPTSSAQLNHNENVYNYLVLKGAKINKEEEIRHDHIILPEILQEPIPFLGHQNRLLGEQPNVFDYDDLYYEDEDEDEDYEDEDYEDEDYEDYENEEHEENEVVKIRKVFRYEECGVCLHKYTDKSKEVIIYPCLHSLCTTCLQYLENKCPVCRSKIKDSFIYKQN